MMLRQALRRPIRIAQQVSASHRLYASVSALPHLLRGSQTSAWVDRKGQVHPSVPASSRSYATLRYKSAAISEDEYHRLSDRCLEALTDSLEQLVEEYDGQDADDYEAEFSSGVLNLRLGSHGTYVINKQPPNKQIWFSSPRSGPKRFDYDKDHGEWFMLKDGEECNFRNILNRELTDIFGKPIEVDLGT